MTRRSESSLAAFVVAAVRLDGVLELHGADAVTPDAAGLQHGDTELSQLNRLRMKIEAAEGERAAFEVSAEDQHRVHDHAAVVVERDNALFEVQHDILLAELDVGEADGLLEGLLGLFQCVSPGRM